MVSASSGPLVEAVSLHPGEAEGDPARVTGAGLDAVDGDLHDLFGAQVDRPQLVRLTSSRGNVSVCQRRISSVIPLKVLPTMTNSPVAGSRAPRWMLERKPDRRPWPHSAAQHHQVEGVDRLDLAPRLSSSPGFVGRLRDP